jgi:hypothetical protein
MNNLHINIQYSNVFNIFFQGVNDVFNSEGSLFKDIFPAHLSSVYH